jgi:RNA polymerase sigma-70 factor, ECF subfamily
MTLEDAIEQLPSAQRKAIELVKARELSLNEAAAVSGVSVAALKVSIHRALRRLRRILLAES